MPQLAGRPHWMWFAELGPVELNGVEVGITLGAAGRGVMDVDPQLFAQPRVLAGLDDHGMPHFVQLVRRRDCVGRIECRDGQELQ